MTPRRILTLIPLIIVVGILFLATEDGVLRTKKTISGQVRDCMTNNPIADVHIEAMQRGWGRGENGGIIWDKNYTSSAKTDGSGKFSITYRVGKSANLKFSKEYYFLHTLYSYPTDNLVVRLLETTDDYDQKYSYNTYDGECELPWSLREN